MIRHQCMHSYQRHGAVGGRLGQASSTIKGSEVWIVEPGDYPW